MAFIDRGVVGGLATERSLVNVAERVKGISTIGIAVGSDGAEVRGEELRVFRNIGLGYHVFDGSCDGGGRDGVDATKGQAEEPVTDALLELLGEHVGEFDGLSFDDKAADVDVVGADGAGGGGAVTVRDLPCGAGGVLEGARLGGIEDGVASSGSRLGELSRPDLVDNGVSGRLIDLGWIHLPKDQQSQYRNPA